MSLMNEKGMPMANENEKKTIFIVANAAVTDPMIEGGYFAILQALCRVILEQGSKINDLEEEIHDLVTHGPKED